MVNSPLVNYTKLSPNRTAPRNNKITKITIHHMAGNLSVESCGAIFAQSSRQASANYGVGSDGKIAMYVEETNRSWCSGGKDAKGNVIRNCGISGKENDHMAVTIEVANDGGSPDWHVSDKAMESLINLCVDICKRNEIDSLVFTGDATGNLTIHKMFADTACPGHYLEGKMKWIAEEVNRRLHPTIYRVQVGAFSVRANAEAYLKKLKAAGFDGIIKEETK